MEIEIEKGKFVYITDKQGIKPVYTDPQLKEPLLCEEHNTPMHIDPDTGDDPYCQVCKHYESDADEDVSQVAEDDLEEEL